MKQRLRQGLRLLRHRAHLPGSCNANLHHPAPAAPLPHHPAPAAPLPQHPARAAPPPRPPSHLWPFPHATHRSSAVSSGRDAMSSVAMMYTSSPTCRDGGGKAGGPRWERRRSSRCAPAWSSRRVVGGEGERSGIPSQLPVAKAISSACVMVAWWPLIWVHCSSAPTTRAAGQRAHLVLVTVDLEPAQEAHPVHRVLRASRASLERGVGRCRSSFLGGRRCQPSLGPQPHRPPQAGHHRVSALRLPCCACCSAGTAAEPAPDPSRYLLLGGLLGRGWWGRLRRRREEGGLGLTQRPLHGLLLAAGRGSRCGQGGRRSCLRLLLLHACTLALSMGSTCALATAAAMLAGGGPAAG